MTIEVDSSFLGWVHCPNLTPKLSYRFPRFLYYLPHPAGYPHISTLNTESPSQNIIPIKLINRTVLFHSDWGLELTLAAGGCAWGRAAPAPPCPWWSASSRCRSSRRPSLPWRSRGCPCSSTTCSPGNCSTQEGKKNESETSGRRKDFTLLAQLYIKVKGEENQDILNKCCLQAALIRRFD